MPEDSIDVRLVVNGVPVEASVPAWLLLSDFLRHTLGLTGTHVGCEHGVCGACNVLLDGSAVRSCLLLAAQTDGHELLTVEGLSRDGSPGPLQAAFVAEQALQCGFCTPGFLIALAEDVGVPADLDDAGIREHLVGNLCRCTGYGPIVAAVRRGAQANERGS
jgi:carbon-monoxide dehydrogenase small subunit